MSRLRAPFVTVVLAVSPLAVPTLAGCRPAQPAGASALRTAVMTTGRLPRGELVVTAEAHDGARATSFTWPIAIGDGRWLEDDPTGLLVAVRDAAAPETVAPGRFRVPIDLRGEPAVATVDAGATVQRVRVELAGGDEGVVALTLEVRTH